MNGLAAYHDHAARRGLARTVHDLSEGVNVTPYERGTDRTPPWARLQRPPTARMPDLALGTPRERRTKRATVTDRLRHLAVSS